MVRLLMKQLISCFFCLNETLIKSFDRLRTNGNKLIPIVLSLAEEHERNQLIQSFLKLGNQTDLTAAATLSIIKTAYS